MNKVSTLFRFLTNRIIFNLSFQTYDGGREFNDIDAGKIKFHQTTECLIQKDTRFSTSVEKPKT